MKGELEEWFPQDLVASLEGGAGKMKGGNRLLIYVAALPPDLLNRNLWGRGLQVCIINTHLLVDSDAQPLVGTAG